MENIKQTAFGKWAKQQNTLDLAHYLFVCFAEGPNDSIVWQIIEEMGITTLSMDAFIEMAEALKTEKAG